MNRLNKEFYHQDAVTLAKELLGKIIVRKFYNGDILKCRITETEAYLGEEDTASHARFGKTERNQIMYNEGGCLYVYLCYGIHYMLNIVCGPKDSAQAVLIRGVEDYQGPGKVTKLFSITKELNNEDLITSTQIWLEEDNYKVKYKTDKRVGINYATPKYRNIKWRFISK